MEAYLKDFPHVKHFNLKEIKSITNDFDNSKVIGKGGFGKVYGGVLSHSKGRSMVAFKRLDRIHGQGDPEFLKEIFMLSRCSHENLISLLGFCDEKGEKILVYEYASHGSLDRHLSSTTLMWRQRVKICLGAARGLCYLHDPKETQQRVIHRDIKSSNILLDENWNAKVSDMGLSRIGPANQPHSFLPTNIVGTPGYIDPQYMETYSLRKESDVYSFGVVLFEVLCGKTCFKYYNPREFEIFVPIWKQSYEEKKLDEIVFHEMKPRMDSRSLKTFSDVAYQCVQKSRATRPVMSQVVKELEIALRFQEDFEFVEQPMDYEELNKTAVPPLVYRSKDELKMLLCKGIFVNDANTWFSLNKKGEHCELISAGECIIPYNLKSVYHGSSVCPSIFPEFYDYPATKKFKVHVRTQFLSPGIPYIVNLVFGYYSTYRGYLDLKYTLAGQTRSWSTCFADARKDGWLNAELYHFTSHGRKFDLQFTVRCKDKFMVEGIEFQPLQWHSPAKEGDKGHVPPESVVLQRRKRRRQPSHESRSKEVVVDRYGRFDIECSPDMLSPQTTYACYIVYKLPEKNSKFKLPVTVRLVTVSSSEFTPYPRPAWYIYLLYSQIPVIGQKVNENTHNPLSRPNMRGLSRLRNDGWMEVQVWEFQTGTTTKRILENLRLTFFDDQPVEGLILEGIEFKPI